MIGLIPDGDRELRAGRKKPPVMRRDLAAKKPAHRRVDRPFRRTLKRDDVAEQLPLGVTVPCRELRKERA